MTTLGPPSMKRSAPATSSSRESATLMRRVMKRRRPEMERCKEGELAVDDGRLLGHLADLQQYSDCAGCGGKGTEKLIMEVDFGVVMV